MTTREMCKQYPYLHRERIAFEKKQSEYKTERGFMNYLKRLNAKYEQKANRKDVRSMTIKLTWKRSSMWGYNPHGRVWVTYQDGTHEYRDGYTCSGCGYDKASTVLSQIFNDFMSGMAWRIRRTKKQVPYGMTLNGWFPHFDYGVGENCYYRIAEFFGGTMKKVAWDDAFDQYEVEFKPKKKAS